MSPLAERECAWCGKPFPPRRRDQKFCGHPKNCRSKAWEAAHPRRSNKEVAALLRKLADELERS